MSDLFHGFYLKSGTVTRFTQYYSTSNSQCKIRNARYYKFLLGGLLALIERCTLKQDKGNFNSQKGRWFIRSATSRINFDSLQQFIFHALYLYLYQKYFIQLKIF